MYGWIKNDKHEGKKGSACLNKCTNDYIYKWDVGLEWNIKVKDTVSLNY